MSLAEKVARRFTAEIAKVSPKFWIEVFRDEEYVLVDVVTVSTILETGKGYLSKSEVAAGKSAFQSQFKKSKDWQKKYEDAAKERSGDLWKKLVQTYKSEEGAAQFVKDQGEHIRQAEHANSVGDVNALYAPYLGPAFYKGEPLLVGRDTANNASRRHYFIGVLEKEGTIKDHKNFALTKAKIEDKPNLAEDSANLANDTEDCIKWLVATRKKIILKHMKVMGDDLDAARKEAYSKYPNSDGGTVEREVRVRELKWRQF
jgi:hypothetical protein